jgi:hypothetical protein
MLLSGNEAVGDSATTGLGGALFNEPGATLTVQSSKFLQDRVVGGTGFGFGGAIMNEGHATVTASTFAGNQATGGAAGYGGGGAISWN